MWNSAVRRFHTRATANYHAFLLQSRMRDAKGLPRIEPKNLNAKLEPLAEVEEGSLKWSEPLEAFFVACEYFPNSGRPPEPAQ